MMQDYYISNGQCVRGLIQWRCIGDYDTFEYAPGNKPCENGPNEYYGAC